MYLKVKISEQENIYGIALEIMEAVRSRAYTRLNFGITEGADDQYSALQLLKILKQLAIDFDDAGKMVQL